MALMAEYAKSKGTVSCTVIIDTMMTVPDDLVPPADFPVWAKMRELAERGSPPSIPALRRSFPAMPADYWVAFRSEESSIRDVRDAVLHEAQLRRYAQFHRDLATMLRAGQPFAEINEAMGRLIDESVAGVREAVPLADVSYMERMLAIQSGKLPMVETPWPVMNRALGGGLFMGDDLAMTAILAYSGVGKTRIAQQINQYGNMAGHWFLVFAGESNRYSYMQGLGTIVAAMPKKRIHKGMDPADIELLRQAEKYLQGQPTRIYDNRFNVDVIRDVMSRTAHQLKESKTRGLTPQGACLVVIVDNIDHAIEGGSQKEWQELEQAAKGLYNTAQRLGCHVIILAQATSGSFLKGYAPGHTDFARAGLIASHCSNVWSAYRPILEEQLYADDQRKDAKFSIAKTRSGQTGTHLMALENEVGLWL